MLFLFLYVQKCEQISYELFCFVIVCDLLPPPHPPIPGVSQSSLLGEKILNKFCFLYFLNLGGILGIWGPNLPPPHPWRQCQSSLPGEKNMEKTS